MSRARTSRSMPVRPDGGQATLELIAMLPFVLLLAGLLFQVGSVVWAITDTTEAARQGARAASMGDGGCAAARAALSGGRGADADCSVVGETLTLTIPAPIFVDAIGDVTIERSATLPDLTDSPGPGLGG